MKQGSEDQVANTESNRSVETKPKTAQQFADVYQKLCEEYGFRINVNPAFIARDDGTFSLVLQTSVGPLPKV